MAVEKLIMINKYKYST